MTTSHFQIRSLFKYFNTPLLHQPSKIREAQRGLISVNPRSLLYLQPVRKIVKMALKGSYWRSTLTVKSSTEFPHFHILSVTQKSARLMLHIAFTSAFFKGCNSSQGTIKAGTPAKVLLLQIQAELHTWTPGEPRTRVLWPCLLHCSPEELGQLRCFPRSREQLGTLARPRAPQVPSNTRAAMSPAWQNKAE